MGCSKEEDNKDCKKQVDNRVLTMEDNRDYNTEHKNIL
jgi:hypothetical protein